MKWRRKPARPVLAVSRAKHKANSQSLSKASNNEAYKYAFKGTHCRGVARKTCPFRGGRARPEPVKGGTDRHKRPIPHCPPAPRRSSKERRLAVPADSDRRGSIRLRTEATARHAERARQGGWTDAAWRDPEGTSHIYILCDPSLSLVGRVSPKPP